MPITRRLDGFEGEGRLNMYDTNEYYTEHIRDHVNTVDELVTEKKKKKLVDLRPKDAVSLFHFRFGTRRSGLLVEEVVLHTDNTASVILRSPGCAGSRSGDWNHPAILVGLATQAGNAVTFREFGEIRYNRAGRKLAFTQAQNWATRVVDLVEAIDAKLEAEERDRQAREAKKEAEHKAQRERACEFVDGTALIEFCSAGNRDAVAIVKRVQRMIAENRKRVGLTD
jgi:hypothetical protein